ncbi:MULTISPECIES: glycerophosphodiester phosphodiesterase [unclassified Herbaspirillum]|uniref:glycerophosphodiester phosphodiesterase n=1 Tax=unclassified Herbaspirillum TaxID=2624150 RepID=UPI0011507CC0|nr:MULTISPECIES: glycerophosphodiester phosphodiesterase [unclassified Herbaspirillum]MBB5391458.1 glycerophosphoryl diester phosphodiesterase [Herbaspirillum sp. SJZ102]TQK12857.1 glycerophosphoryl diester phosphodiesterase [Herbaspirillum sp. SJZ130]TQK14861.1 glycerophosphoryl diester phosphodiesterase [Herbaspirillum sp. SJZ106]TWC67216.1 glycerophosphoryl diester phosphodiesterase [Herbaspirillum sp. SJZ099]
MWPYPKVLAHRGGGTLAPENTLAGFRTGLRFGYRAAEFDVMLTRDEVPILMHDPQRGRTLPGAGQIAETDWAQLCELDAGAWHGPAFAGERICTLEQGLDFCIGHGIWMNVEIKPAAPAQAARTGELTALAVGRRFSAALEAWRGDPASAQAAALPVLSSFSFDALMAAREAAPDLPRGFLMDTLADDWQAHLQQLQAVALHTNHRHLTPELARRVKEAGYALFCYTVNDAARAAQIMDWGVDAFCTDRIDLIRADAY